MRVTMGSMGAGSAAALQLLHHVDCGFCQFVHQYHAKMCYYCINNSTTSIVESL